jgi:hypothetical protein
MISSRTVTHDPVVVARRILLLGLQVTDPRTVDRSRLDEHAVTWLDYVLQRGPGAAPHRLPTL